MPRRSPPPLPALGSLFSGVSAVCPGRLRPRGARTGIPSFPALGRRTAAAVGDIGWPAPRVISRTPLGLLSIFRIQPTTIIRSVGSFKSSTILNKLQRGGGVRGSRPE
nr:MAG TPA: hypothetical protein [Caudoviricetes sp.]